MVHVSALFPNGSAAREAVEDLLDAGFSRHGISLVLAEDAGEPSQEEERTRVGESVAAGGALGALIGGIAALASLGIPGGFVVTGPITAFFGGAGVGAVGGGLIGALVAAGLSQGEATELEARIREGDILVGVQTGDPMRAALAERVLAAAGARNPPQTWPRPSTPA